MPCRVYELGIPAIGQTDCPSEQIVTNELVTKPISFKRRLDVVYVTDVTPHFGKLYYRTIYPSLLYSLIFYKRDL